MTLALDTTGLATANRIEGEQIAVTPAVLNTFGCLYPAAGPIFDKNFAITYTPATVGATASPLVKGTDYDFKFELEGFDEDTSGKVWGAICLFNQSLNGTIEISYQALGGNWTIDQQAVRNYLNSNQFNSNIQHQVLVSKDPLHLPNNPLAEWPLNSIEAITIAQSQMPNIILSVAFVSNSGIDDGISEVIVTDLPLPPNAAKETGGNLSTIANAQGAAATGVNQMTGGSGILGWLSGMFAQLVSLVTSIAAIATRLNSSFLAAQSGVWTVGLNAGTNLIGSTMTAPLSSVVDTVSTPGYMYISEAVPGTVSSAAGWRVQKINLTTGATQWAAGGAFTQIADNASSLTFA
jgi:hypothetical protein